MLEEGLKEQGQEPVGNKKRKDDQHKDGLIAMENSPGMAEPGMDIMVVNREDFSLWPGLHLERQRGIIKVR